MEITHSHVSETGERGSADWVAVYVFSATGRRVINRIHAEFEFKDGKIYRHRDSFNLHKWASQAMGFKGKLLGGTSFFRKKVQKTGPVNLRKAKRPGELSSTNVGLRGIFGRPLCTGRSTEIYWAFKEQFFIRPKF